MGRPQRKPLRELTDEYIDLAYDELVRELSNHGNMSKALSAAKISRFELMQICEIDNEFEWLLHLAKEDFVDRIEDELIKASESNPMVRLKVLAALRPHQYDRSGVAQLRRATNSITAEKEINCIEGHFEDEKPKELENSAAAQLAAVREAAQSD